MTSPLPTAPAPARQVRPTDVPGVAELQALTRGNRRVCVAVLDGPLDASHPCFAGAALSQQRVPGLEVRGGGPATAHGTLVASILFGQRGGPAPGLVPDCRGLSLPIFGLDEAGGVRPCSQLDLARAIAEAVRWAESQAAAALVINVSGGQFTTSGEAQPLLAKTLAELDSQRVLLAAAAGNDGCDCLHLPGAHPAVLAVGGMDAQGEPLPLSNWGAAYQEHGLLAPGAQIAGAAPGGGLTAGTGTSYATPLVAGAAALLLSWQLAQGRPASAAAVRAALLQSAHGCDVQPTADCRRLLSGRLNLSGALNVLRAAPLNPQGDCNMSMLDDNASPKPSGLAADQSCALSPETFAPAAAAAVVPAAASPADVALPPAEGALPSDCGCGGKCKQAPQLVFALGKLSVDYRNRQRRDFFAEDMRRSLGRECNIDHLPDVLAYLTVAEGGARRGASADLANLAKVTALTWTLKLDDSPIYALAPGDAFAAETHRILVGMLKDQIEEGAERVSVPGILGGNVRLYSGETVPTIAPDVRGLYSWDTPGLIQSIATQQKADAEKAKKSPPVLPVSLADFFERVYFELRNLGVTPQERALNYAATDALRAARVYEEMFVNPRFAGYELDAVETERSPLCRADSDCWDVRIVFFNPANTRESRRVYRWTIDVTDVMPVMIGSVRSWSIR